MTAPEKEKPQPTQQKRKSNSEKRKSLSKKHADADRSDNLWTKLNGEWIESLVVLKGETLEIYESEESQLKTFIRIEGKTVRTLEANEVRAEAPRRNCLIIESKNNNEEENKTDEKEEEKDVEKEDAAQNVGLDSLMLSNNNANDSLTWIAILKRATKSCNWTGRPSTIENCTVSSSASYVAPKLKPLNSANVIDTPLLFREKLEVCSSCWHFSVGDPNKNSLAKEFKRKTLVELVQFIDTPRAQHAFIDDIALRDMIKMISLNIFRPVTLFDGRTTQSFLDRESPEQFMEPNWPHLSIIYELLLHVVESGLIPLDMKKRCFENRFCTDIIQLFRSQDMREREYVKMVTHCLYSRLMNRRACMRKSMANAFLEFLYISRSNDGIAEMLEVYGSVASGFAVPIKAEHKAMLTKCLFPLHTSFEIDNFHEQLCFILLQYSSKEPDLAVWAIKAILRYWPNANANKQVLFLNELEELIEVMRPSDLDQIQDVLLRQLCMCIEGEHFQVAERAIALWNNETLCAIVLENRNARELAYPALFSSLHRTWKRCWNPSVRQLAEGLLGFLQALDYDMYHRCETMRIAK